jgi:hypothetical protein
MAFAKSLSGFRLGARRELFKRWVLRDRSIESKSSSIQSGKLFNSMDPPAFHEKDLDRDEEEFIVSWAQEVPRKDPISLIVHLNQIPPHARRGTTH